MKFCGMQRISLNAPDGTFPDTHLKSDRRDLPQADERKGDGALLRHRLHQPLLCHARASDGWLLLTHGAIV